MEIELVSWANPWAFGFGFGLLILYIGLKVLAFRQRKSIESMIERRFWPKLLPGLVPSSARKQMGLMSVALVFGILAAARPQWGQESETTQWKGLDLMILVDISNSMHTEDVPPSRFQQARKLARTVVDQVRGDRVGLIAFAGDAQMVSPLTADTDFVKESLDALDSKWILAQGSDLGGALRMARESLERGAEAATENTLTSGKLVLMFTDGEDLEETATQEAARLVEAGISLGLVGIGTEAGAPVPIRNDQGVLQGYKKDSKGTPVVSRINAELIRTLAASAKGQWWIFSGGDRQLKDVVDFIGSHQRGEQTAKTSVKPIERYMIPLGIALLFLVLAASVRWSKSVLASLLLLCLSLPAWAGPVDVYQENKAGMDAFAQGDFEGAKKHFGSARALDPKNPLIQYNEGVAQGALGQTEQAEKLLDGLKSTQEFSGQVQYNLGTILQKKNQMEQAIQHWSKAAEIFESQGKTDLADMARRKILALKPPPPQPQQSPQPSPSQNPQPDQKQNPSKSPSEGEKKFQSKRLSPEDAKRVMDELGSREKDLKKKLERKNDRQREQKNRGGRDW